MNDAGCTKQSWRDDSDVIFVSSLINPNNFPTSNNEMNNWYINLPPCNELYIDGSVEEVSMKNNKWSQKKKWLPAGKKADKSDPELQNLSNSYISPELFIFIFCLILYFWERRNILLEMLKSYTDDDTILISATEKSTKKVGGKVVSKRPRGSQYRGVSKNKAKWQVMIMGNFKKMYFGAIEDEREAALFYDKLAIVSHGIKARTNFDYTRRDIISILNEDWLSRVWNQ